MTKSNFDKQRISNYITKNAHVEKYTLLGYEDESNEEKEREWTEEKIENETIVNEIIKNNPTQVDEMIHLIETL